MLDPQCPLSALRCGRSVESGLHKPALRASRSPCQPGGSKAPSRQPKEPAYNKPVGSQGPLRSTLPWTRDEGEFLISCCGLLASMPTPNFERRVGRCHARAIPVCGQGLSEDINDLSLSLASRQDRHGVLLQLRQPFVVCFRSKKAL